MAKGTLMKQCLQFYYHLLARPLLAVVLTIVSFASLASAQDFEPITQEKILLSYEQRLVFSYSLLAYQQPKEVQDEIYKRLLKQVQSYTSTKAQIVNVKTFPDFLKYYKGQWPNSESLARELELIEQRPARGFLKIQSNIPSLQSRIEKFYLQQFEANKNLIQRNIESIKDKPLTIDLFIQALSKKNSSLTLEIFKNLSETIIGTTISQLDRMGDFISAQNVEPENAQENDLTKSPVDSGKVNDATKAGFKIFVEKFFGVYFKELSLDSKKLMISALMEEPLNIDPLKQFEILIQNSGPQLQKFLQVIARKNLFPKNLADLFNKLEDAVKPVPWETVLQIIESEKSNYNFASFEQKPLGVGTMAQVHRAKIVDMKGNLQPVVVRFMKPNILIRLLEDHRILKLVAAILDQEPLMKEAGFPPLSPLVDDITRTVTDELSQPDTMKRQEVAAPSYNKIVYFKTPEYKNTLEFHVPHLVPSKNPSKLMVQEMVFGKKLEKNYVTWKELIPNLKTEISEQLTSLWIDELIFGKGVYHSDLHQGNFILDIKDDGFRLNILDFGMGGKISPKTQKNVLRLGFAIEIEDTEKIAKEFWNARDKDNNQLSFKDLQSSIQEFAKTATHKLTPNEWNNHVLGAGLKLSYDLISVNRGIETLATLLETSGSQETTRTITKKIALSHPVEIYKILTEGGFATMDLIRLGLSEAKSRFSSKSDIKKSAENLFCSQSLK